MSQTITPELRRWIIEQASAGFTPEVVLASMMSSGWQESVAVAALESTLREHLEEQAKAKAAAEAAGGQADAEPERVPVPDLDMERSPRQLDAGDRMVDVIVSVGNPRVVVLGNLPQRRRVRSADRVGQAAPGAFAHRADQDRW